MEYPRYDISLSNSLHSIRHNHWTMKYRSHWPTYILRSLFMSDRTNIQHTTFLYQIVFEIRHNHWIMKYRSNWPTYILRSLLVSHETNIQGMTFLCQSLWDMRHNHWTMKCRSQWPNNILRSLLVSHGTNIQGMKFLHQIEIKGKITGPWNKGHCTVKCRSPWPSPNDTLSNVTSLTDVLPRMCLQCWVTTIALLVLHTGELKML